MHYSSGMGTSRARRTVRWIVIAVSTPILLLSWYIAAWFAVSRAIHNGYINGTTAQTIRPAFVPLLKYCESELPGARRLCDLWWRVNPRFTVITIDGMVPVQLESIETTIGFRSGPPMSNEVVWIRTSPLAPPYRTE